MPSRTFGVISPHPPIFVPGVGGREAHVAQASLDALETARLALDEFAPETLVLMSPHAPAASDAFVIETGERVAGSLGQFGDADAYSWPGDPAFARALLERLAAEGIPAVARGDDTRLRPGWLDHATIVPLHFLDPSMARRLVIISLSYLPYEMHRRVGAVVADTVDDLGRSTAFIASGDLSHRLKPGAPAGYSPRAADLDEAIVSRVRAGRLGPVAQSDFLAFYYSLSSSFYIKCFCF